MICMLFQSCSSVYYHHMLTYVICTCTFPLLFHILIGSLPDDPGFAHPDWMFGARMLCEDPEFFFYSILIFLLLFYSCYFLILSISHPVVISFLFHMISCVDIYIYYCSDYDLLQLILYSLFRLL